jgi:hypothetical protein
MSSGFSVKPRQKPPVDPAELAAFAAGAESGVDPSKPQQTTVDLNDKRRNPAFPLRLTERELAELKIVAATTPHSMHEFCIKRDS